MNKLIRNIIKIHNSMQLPLASITALKRWSKFKQLARRWENNFFWLKIFVLKKEHNAQNNRGWSASIFDIPEHKRAVERYQNHTTVMVWRKTSKIGKLLLVFINRAVKIIQKYYLEEVFKKVVLPGANAFYEDEYYLLIKTVHQLTQQTLFKTGARTCCVILLRKKIGHPAHQILILLISAFEDTCSLNWRLNKLI